MLGILYGVGVGVGDPELLTIKALNTIKKCDVICIPSDNREECYAYKIVESVYEEISTKDVLAVKFPMSKDKKQLEDNYKKVAKLIEEKLDQGKDVAFLTIGDSTLYSTYSYVQKIVENDGYKQSYINGISSIMAMAAALNIPVAEQNEQVHIIPASYDIEESFSLKGTKIYMKAGKKLEELKKMIEESNFSNVNIYGISNCGLDNEIKAYGIEELDKLKGYLTIIVIKDDIKK